MSHPKEEYLKSVRVHQNQNCYLLMYVFSRKKYHDTPHMYAYRLYERLPGQPNRCLDYESLLNFQNLRLISIMCIVLTLTLIFEQLNTHVFKILSHLSKIKLLSWFKLC